MTETIARATECSGDDVDSIVTAALVPLLAITDQIPVMVELMTQRLLARLGRPETYPMPAADVEKHRTELRQAISMYEDLLR